MSHYKHIMIALDFNNDDPLLIEKAVHFAQVEKAKLNAIHISHTAGHPYHGMIDVNLEKANEVITQQSDQTLSDILNQFCHHPVEPHILSSDHIASALTKAIKHYNIDLLLIGHHRYSWFEEIFKSTSEALIRKMACDIMLIKCP